MISEWFIDIGLGLQAWFLGLFGDEPIPDWLTSTSTFISELGLRVSGLGAWVPLGLLGTVCVGLLGFWGLFWLVKGIRWVWGLTPFSGGS